ncbi:hypothetical protein niasHS_012887 [Heterodera schachtii]|uniref:Uncharacterized protein n=1 Tax=Heterodera schachtii TaxID=97005 RepID=A0ABD2IP13_HETSC
MGRKASKDASDSEDPDYEDDLNNHFTCVRDGQFEELVVRVRNALTRRKRPNINSLRDASEDTDYEDDLNSNVACVRDGKFEDLIVRVRSALKNGNGRKLTVCG